MAGTMPHAIFLETGLDGGSTVAAYAAELPGCATFAAADAEAVAAMPRRVARFSPESFGQAQVVGNREAQGTPRAVCGRTAGVERRDELVPGGIQAVDRVASGRSRLAANASHQRYVLLGDRRECLVA